jgi:hypothetical protein
VMLDRHAPCPKRQAVFHGPTPSLVDPTLREGVQVHGQNIDSGDFGRFALQNLGRQVHCAQTPSTGMPLTDPAQRQRGPSDPEMNHNEDFIGKVTAVSERPFHNRSTVFSIYFSEICFTL